VQLPVPLPVPLGLVLQRVSILRPLALLLEPLLRPPVPIRVQPLPVLEPPPILEQKQQQ
jgi:hypothetical protein